MSASPFQYAVLRVIPHLARGESMNVGVVVFCRPRKYLDVRVEVDEARFGWLAPGVDPGPVRERLDNIVRIARGEPDAGPIAAMDISERFHWIAAPSSTIIQPGPVHTGLSDAPEALLERLFASLVAVPDGAAPAPAAVPPRLAAMRRTYAKGALDEADAAPTWLAQFERWFAEADVAIGRERNAMIVATPAPGARTVLLKDVDERGFVFFTHKGSQKGRELEADPRAAIVFPWYELERQVLVRGATEELDEAANEAYWQERPVGSRLSAAVSPQSEVIGSRAALEQARAELAARVGDDVPRPPQWGGIRVVPDSVEFWQGRPDRLHDRLRFRRGDGGAWVVERLAP